MLYQGVVLGNPQLVPISIIVLLNLSKGFSVFYSKYRIILDDFTNVLPLIKEQCIVNVGLIMHLIILSLDRIEQCSDVRRAKVAHKNININITIF